MFLDASAIVAILAREADASALLKRIEAAAPPLYVSPLARFEAVFGLARAKAKARADRPDLQIANAAAVVEAFLSALGAVEVPITSEIGVAAIEAGRRYGRAVGSAADLNFGDCFAYACARQLGVPLLYKGQDFAQTDLR